MDELKNSDFLGSHTSAVLMQLNFYEVTKNLFMRITQVLTFHIVF